MGLINDLHDAFKVKDLETLDKLMADEFVFCKSSKWNGSHQSRNAWLGLV